MVDGKISFIGFGLSNRAMYEFLKGYGYEFVVRSREWVSVPDGVRCIFGDSYLDTDEEMVFRSPSCMPRCIRGRGRILSEASVALSNIPSHKIAVTGSDGKTTVATLIQKMLEEGGASAYLGGNNGYPLIKYAGKLRSNDYLVCELSSFQLIDMTPSVDTAVITGITENHLDIHASMWEYVSAKANILKNCRRAVIAIDNGYADFFIKNAPRNVRLVYATLDHKKALTDPKASYVYPRDGYIYFDNEALFPLGSIALRGNFNILNVCMAAGAVHPYAKKEHIRAAVEKFRGVPSRMELVGVKSGIFFYDSSIDSTPARTVATLSAFPRDRTVVLLGGYDKNLSYDILRDGIRGIKCAVICGANSEKIYSSVKGVCEIRLCSDLNESIKTAYRMAKAGDSIVLSPASASFDAFENYKKRSEKFKETVRGL